MIIIVEKVHQYLLTVQIFVIHLYNKHNQYNKQQQQQQTQQTQPDKISADVAEFNKKVQKLQVLKKQGILDDSEYEEARQKLMKQVTGLL